MVGRLFSLQLCVEYTYLSTTWAVETLNFDHSFQLLSPGIVNREKGI